jgi:hypothetical protein
MNFTVFMHVLPVREIILLSLAVAVMGNIILKILP